MNVQEYILAPGRGRSAAFGRGFHGGALVVVLTLAVADGRARADPATAPAGHARVQPPPPTLLRYDEDYAYLADPDQRSDPWDPLKYLPLGPPGWYATLGGETRQRFECYTHYPFKPGLQDRDGYYLQRYMGLVDVHLGPAVRAFAEVKSALVDAKRVVFPVDRDRLDLDQAFVDLRAPLGDGGAESVTLRVGREELQYGSGRLIAVREGPNNRQSFDGARLIVHAGGWQADALLVRQVDDRPGIFDNQEVTGQELYGVYATRPLLGPAAAPTVGVDLYALGYRQPAAEFVRGSGVEERYSVGTRWFGNAGGWDYDVEGTYQFGRFGPAGSIAAYYVGEVAGYTFASAPLAPRLGLGADVASGDRGGPNGTQTFDPMFARGNYYDEASLFINSNVYALHPTLDLHPTPTVDVQLDAVVLWRQSTSDGIYAPNVTPALMATGRSAGRFVGVQPTAQVTWQADRHLTLTASYSHLFDGPYARAATPFGGGREVEFLAAWLNYKF